MSGDLVDQLAEYGRQHRNAQHTIALAEIVADHAVRSIPEADDLDHRTNRLDHRINEWEITMAVTPAPSTTPAKARRRWLVGSAVAAVAIVFVAGIALLRSGGDEPADQVASASTSTDLDRGDTSPPATTDTVATTTATAATTTDAPSIDPESPAPVPVVPADALRSPAAGEVGASSDTPLPDFDAAELADSAEPPRTLSSVDDLPDSARLDFLAEFCDGARCFRDASFRDANGANLGGGWGAGEPFHIRHGFVNDGPGDLGDGFDVAIYVFPMPAGGQREAFGPTQRFTTDYLVRGETDACGPSYLSQTGTVTCDWFVHDFPNGLPQGRWALWAVWEAPCTAWVDLGLNDECDDPDEVMSFFSSGVDSPFSGGSSGNGGETIVTQVGEWTRVDGLGVDGLVSDGTTFFAGDGPSLLRSDDGVAWEEFTEPDELFEQFQSLFNEFGRFYQENPPAAVRDGRLVAVEDLRGISVIVHVVDPDGNLSTQVVPVVVPAAYEPFHRELNPGVHLIDNGRIVIMASYSADAGLVEATGRSRADLGLDLFYPIPRPIVIVSDDGVTWTQLETPPDGVLSVTTAPGGLVAHTGAIHGGVADRVVSFSTDGAVWQPVIDPDTGVPLGGRGGIASVNNRAFLMDDGQRRIWEITIDGARLIAGAGAAPEPLELFGSFYFGGLSAGDAGLAYVVAVDEEMRDPAPDGSGIRYSVDDGETWAFEPFPEELATGFPGALSVGASQIAFLLHGTDGEAALWVRDFPS